MIPSWLRVLGLLAAAGIASCSNGGSSNFGGKNGGHGASGGAAGGDDAGSPLLDASQSDASRPVVGHLRGKVFAPEGTIPISGALVYTSPSPPPPIPNGVYCDKCVNLEDDSDDFTKSNPDGSFDLPVTHTGQRYLVVRKGQFRRVRLIDVKGGEQQVPKEFTTFPNRTDDAHGDHIPRMAVIVGAWDAIEVSLAKLGLGKVVNGFLGKKTVDDATASFDLYRGMSKNPYKLLREWDTIKQYNIVFIPCSGSDGTECNDFTSGEKAVQENLRKFVRAGGKLYVTDYSYDYLRQPFPGYIDWEGQTSEIGSACQDGSYTAPAQVDDKGLREWLQAIGINQFKVRQNWTTIQGVHTVQGIDADGNPAKITPKIWVTALKHDGPHPSTVSFQYGCGRALFSTYHTEADDTDAHTLLPQEKALLYVLLEVAVCVDVPTPK